MKFQSIVSKTQSNQITAVGTARRFIMKTKGELLWPVLRYYVEPRANLRSFRNDIH